MSTLFVGDSHVNRLRTHVGTEHPSSIVFNIAGLPSVSFYGISGGLVSNNKHLSLITAAVRQRRPRHVIACIGGNDLDTSDPGWNPEILITRLVTFLTQLKNCFNLRKVTILSFFPRERTRHVSPETYRQRTMEANQLLCDLCAQHHLKFWKLRGFTDSSHPILCDGVHLNVYGMNKLLRQLRGVLLSQL